jgi:WD40 repeat protein
VNDIASLALSPDGHLLAYGGYSDNLVHLIDVATGEKMLTLQGHNAPVASLAFSPNGRLLASSSRGGVSSEEDTSVRLWDISAGHQIALFETLGTNQVGFSPDGLTLAAAGVPDADLEESAQVRLWDVETASAKGNLRGVFGDLAFSPAGNLLASGGRDGVIHVFEIAGGREVMTLDGNIFMIDATAFSPTGAMLAAGNSDATIQLWDSTAGVMLKSLTGHKSSVEFVAFDPSSAVLASLGSGVMITSTVSSGQLRMEIDLVPEDKVVRFWDVETGKQVGSISVPDGVTAVSFNADWSLVATADNKGLVQFWTAKQQTQR